MNFIVFHLIAHHRFHCLRRYIDRLSTSMVCTQQQLSCWAMHDDDALSSRSGIDHYGANKYHVIDFANAEGLGKHNATVKKR